MTQVAQECCAFAAQTYPSVALAVVPIFNLGREVELILTLEAVAQIFAGEIVTWDDRRIVASNPLFATWKIPPNQTIEVVVRGDGSTSTGLFKKALGRFWTGFTTAVGSGGKPDWKARPVTQTPGASPGMRAYIAKTQYSIGYATLGEATESSLPMVRLKKEGGFVVVPRQR